MKNSFLNVCFFLLNLFIVLESHAVESRPSWVEGQSLQYPEKNYLTALGSGDGRRSAEKNAYAALRQVFLQPESRRQKEKVAGKVVLRQGAARQNKFLFEQFKISEYWLDPLSQVHYALAVLNRTKAQTAFRRKLLALEGEIKIGSERARGAKYPLIAVKALHQALRASRQADEYQDELRVIAPNDASPLEESVMSADLQNKLDDLLRRYFQVEIALEGPHAAEVETTILERLNQMGLISGPEASLFVTGAIRFEKTGPKSPVWHFMRWSTRITLREKGSAQVFGSIRNTGREGKLTPEEAEQASLAALQSEVNKTIEKRMFQYLFGD